MGVGTHAKSALFRLCSNRVLQKRPVLHTFQSNMAKMAKIWPFWPNSEKILSWVWGQGLF